MDKLKKFNNTLSRIGNTDLVRLERLEMELDLKNELYVKCENNNPTGSISDRFVEAAINLLVLKKDLKKGDKLVSKYQEDFSTSLAFVVTNHGFLLTIVCKKDLSKNRVDMLRSLGANLVFSDKENYGKELATKMNCEYFDSFYREVKKDLKIPLIKELEIQLEDYNYIFVSENSGFLFEDDDSKVIRVQFTGKSNMQESEQVKVKDAILSSRLLIKTEGLLVGKKSGMVLSGAISYLKNMDLNKNEDLKIILILEDSLISQETVIINENNLISRKILTGKEQRQDISYCGKNSFSDLKPIAFYDNRLTVGDCYDLLNTRLSFVPIRKEGKIFGVIDQKCLLKNVIVKNLDKNNSCMECVRKDFFLVDYDVPFAVVEKMLEEKEYVVIVKRNEDRTVKNVYGICIKDIFSLIDNEMKEIV